jgi:hypothetical protein
MAKNGQQGFTCRTHKPEMIGPKGRSFSKEVIIQIEVGLPGPPWKFAESNRGNLIHFRAHWILGTLEAEDLDCFELIGQVIFYPINDKTTLGDAKIIVHLFGEACQNLGADVLVGNPVEGEHGLLVF